MIITVVFAIGLLQLAWLSIMLVRRGISPATIHATLPPMLSIWVLLWPLYEHPIWIWAGIMLLGLPTLLAYSSKHKIWQQLRVAWSAIELSREEGERGLPHMWPFISLIASLSIAAAFFQRSPEFGLGIALATLLAFPLASLMDKTKHLKLGFPLHPEQTLIGHISLIVAVSIICTWSIHTYHGIEWNSLLIATLIAGLAASVIRAFSPSSLMFPLATLAMGTTLWLL